jgi:hypothetical protein
MRTHGPLLSCWVIVLAVASGAAAQSWSEIDDAPEFPAGCGQPVTGTGLVQVISGETSTAKGDSVDSYLIEIVQPEAFFATTSPGMDADASADWNTRLFLFDTDGTGAIANENAPVAANGESYIGSPGMFVGVVGPTVQSLDPGRYVLVITGAANDPVDGSGAALFDLTTIDIALVGPDPGVGDFDRWANSGKTKVQSGPYVIAVQGVQFITEVTEPCPADVNCDLLVNVDDLTDLIIAWGTDDPRADVDDDGLVGIGDLLVVLLGWGPCR